MHGGKNRVSRRHPKNLCIRLNIQVEQIGFWILLVRIACIIFHIPFKFIMYEYHLYINNY